VDWPHSSNQICVHPVPSPVSFFSFLSVAPGPPAARRLTACGSEFALHRLFHPIFQGYSKVRGRSSICLRCAPCAGRPARAWS